MAGTQEGMEMSRMAWGAAVLVTALAAGLAGCATTDEPTPTSMAGDGGTVSPAPTTTADQDPTWEGQVPGPAGDYDSFGLDNGQFDPPSTFPVELTMPAFDCVPGDLYTQMGVGYWPGADGRWRHDCLANVSADAFTGGTTAAMEQISGWLTAQGLTVSALAQCPYPGIPELGSMTYVLVTGFAQGGVAAIYGMGINMGEPGTIADNTSAWSVSVYYQP
jgi:hypothetical protein